MPVQNDFVAWAVGAGANVLSPSALAANAALGQGFQAGVAPSNTFNAIMRQASFIAAMIAKFTADYGGADVVDNGDTAGMETLFVNALNKYIGTLGGLVHFGHGSGAVANTYVVSSWSPTLTSLADGTVLFFKADSTNTGDATLNGKHIKKLSNSILQSQDILVNTIVEVVYDQAADIYWLQGNSELNVAGTGGGGVGGGDGNTITGSGTPSNALGSNGDYYIDISARILYGPKATGAWPGTGTLLGVKFTAATTAPSTTTLGDIWLDRSQSVLFMYASDGTTAAWLDVSGGGAITVPLSNFTFPIAPSSGQLYTAPNGVTYKYSNGGWVFQGDVIAWTSTGRPATPAVGVHGYNTTLSYEEVWNGVRWVPIGIVDLSGFVGTSRSDYPIGSVLWAAAGVSSSLSINQKVWVRSAIGKIFWYDLINYPTAPSDALAGTWMCLGYPTSGDDFPALVMRVA